MDYGLSANLNLRIQLADEWRPIVEGTGVPVSAVSPEDMVLVAGSIIRDPAVVALRFQPEFQIPERGTCAFRTNWPKLFAALGPVACAELAARVRKVWNR
ncbi:MAG: hypothetical protein ACRD20_19535 [Terriglobales bacterium]